MRDQMAVIRHCGRSPSLIPSIRELEVQDDPAARQYSFTVATSLEVAFSSRVISHGTLRMLALLAILNDTGIASGALMFYGSWKR